MQCVHCGYVSSPKFIGSKEENKEYEALTGDMKNWSKEALGRIWIPSIFTLPDGMIYPENEEDVMKWKLADLSMKSDYKVETLGGDGKDLLIRITFDDGDIYEGWVDKQ